MLANIQQDHLPQKRLNCVLQFGYAPLLKRVVMDYGWWLMEIYSLVN